MLKKLLKIGALTALLGVILLTPFNSAQAAWQAQNSDTFNRSNGELVGATMSDGSGVWASNDNATSVHSVSSNQYLGAAGSWANVPLYNTTMSSSQGDQAAEVTVVSTAGGNGVGGPVVRYNSGPQYYYLKHETNAIRLYYGSSGFPGSQLASSGTNLTAGDVLRLEVIGTTLTWFVNGSQDGTATDSTLSTGRAGIWLAFSGTFDTYNDYIPAAGGGAPATRRRSPSPLIID